LQNTVIASWEQTQSSLIGQFTYAPSNGWCTSLHQHLFSKTCLGGKHTHGNEY
jgi:hypothetical protein